MSAHVRFDPTRPLSFPMDAPIYVNPALLHENEMPIHPRVRFITFKPFHVRWSLPHITAFSSFAKL